MLLKYDWSGRQLFKRWGGHSLKYPKSILKNDNVSWTQANDELKFLQ